MNRKTKKRMLPYHLWLTFPTLRSGLAELNKLLFQDYLTLITRTNLSSESQLHYFLTYDTCCHLLCNASKTTQIFLLNLSFSQKFERSVITLIKNCLERVVLCCVQYLKVVGVLRATLRKTLDFEGLKPFFIWRARKNFHLI